MKHMTTAEREALIDTILQITGAEGVFMVLTEATIPCGNQMKDRGDGAGVSCGHLHENRLFARGIDKKFLPGHVIALLQGGINDIYD